MGIGFSEQGQKPTSETAAQDSHGQEKVRAAMDPSRIIQRDPSGRDYTVDMGMEQQVLAPRMKHGEETDTGAKASRISGDLQQCLRNGAEQQAIEAPDLPIVYTLAVMTGNAYRIARLYPKRSRMVSQSVSHCRNYRWVQQ
jgi:hypothetical protein